MNTSSGRAPWFLAGIAVLMQIAWPLTDGGARATTTTLSVLLFAAASLLHAAVHQGLWWMMQYAVTTALFGLAIEVLGSRTGIPFSDYHYTEALQPQILDVPVVVPLAWLMMAYPVLVAARTLAGGRWTRIAVGAYTLTAWDLFLDPQMVGAGYWTWTGSLPSLPGIPGIPWLNYLGWLAAAGLLMVMLSPLPDRPGSVGVPALLLGWTWAGGIVGNAVFFGRPLVALIGGLALGVVVLPFLLRVWGARRDRHDLPASASP